MGVFNVSLGNYTRVPGSPPLCTPEGPELSDEQIMEQLFGGAIVRIIDLPTCQNHRLSKSWCSCRWFEEEIAEDHIVTLESKKRCVSSMEAYIEL